MFTTIFAMLALPSIFFSVLIVSFFSIALSIDTKEFNSDASSYFGDWLLSLFAVFVILLATSSYLNISIDEVSSMILTNPLYFLGSIVCYFFFGTIWAFGKWYFYLCNVRDFYLELKKNYIKENKLENDFLQDAILSDINERCSEEEKNRVQKQANINYAFVKVVMDKMKFYQRPNFSNFGEEYFDSYAASRKVSLIVMAIKPLASSHKNRIIQWIAFWPVSCIWTLINDPIRKFATYIYNKQKKVFGIIGDNIFKGV